MLAIGLMSGTSMDGIDSALLRTDGEELICDIGQYSLEYDPEMKILLKVAERAVKSNHGDMLNASETFLDVLNQYLREVLQLRDESERTAKAQRLLNYLNDFLSVEVGLTPAVEITLQRIIERSTYLHILAVEQLLAKCNLTASGISLVGYHGQTLFHSAANKISIIVGDCQLMANKLSIPVIGNFRANDIQRGGQGAPFAPLYHRALARKHAMPCLAVVNCGGIANMTVISGNEVYAFDTGPGNGLLDNFVRSRTSGLEHMDTDGRYGKEGKVDSSVMRSLCEKSILMNGLSYFCLPPPKSLDINDMVLISEVNGLSLEDGCATLAEFTAETVANSINLLAPTLPRQMVPPQWVLCGGGWYNPNIRAALTKKLVSKFGDEVRVQTADEVGWNNQYMEAQVFAYLGVRSLKKLPLSLPSTTGVPEPLTGGDYFSPQ